MLLSYCIVFKGRAGKGNIYVWATGNGGLTDDDCNCDGYTTSIHTISVGCIGDHGLSAYYTELCSSTLAVTFNGGSHREKEENKIVSNDDFLSYFLGRFILTVGLAAPIGHFQITTFACFETTPDAKLFT